MNTINATELLNTKIETVKIEETFRTFSSSCIQSVQSVASKLFSGNQYSDDVMSVNQLQDHSNIFIISLKNECYTIYYFAFSDKCSAGSYRVELTGNMTLSAIEFEILVNGIKSIDGKYLHSSFLIDDKFLSKIEVNDLLSEIKEKKSGSMIEIAVDIYLEKVVKIIVSDDVVTFQNVKYEDFK